MEGFEPLRRKSLLDHFTGITDTRQSCKVMYPLDEVLLLVVCGTICACDDYDDIVLWGKTHLDFLCAATGPSKTAFTGCWTSSSRKINPDCGAATEPKTWPLSDTSLSISCAPNHPNGPSKANENSPAGIPAHCAPSSDYERVNLDSLPGSAFRPVAHTAQTGIQQPETLKATG